MEALNVKADCDFRLVYCSSLTALIRSGEEEKVTFFKSEKAPRKYLDEMKTITPQESK